MVQSGLMCVLSSDTIRAYFSHLRDRHSHVAIQVCMCSFPCKHPGGAFAWFHVRFQDGSRAALVKSHFCEGVCHFGDSAFASFTPAWMIASSYHCRVRVEVNMDISGLVAKALSPTERWASVRSLCCKEALNLVSCSQVVFNPCPLQGWHRWTSSICGIALARVLQSNADTCVKQKALMRHCVAAYPDASELSHAQKRRKVSAGSVNSCGLLGASADLGSKKTAAAAASW
eukprot:523970-Amphidinium_carterae.1